MYGNRGEKRKAADESASQLLFFFVEAPYMSIETMSKPVDKLS
jgi:hypothetical protein